jgi:hypothetical protein
MRICGPLPERFISFDRGVGSQVAWRHEQSRTLEKELVSFEFGPKVKKILLVSNDRSPPIQGVVTGVLAASANGLVAVVD